MAEDPTKTNMDKGGKTVAETQYLPFYLNRSTKKAHLKITTALKLYNSHASPSIREEGR